MRELVCGLGGRLVRRRPRVLEADDVHDGARGGEVHYLQRRVKSRQRLRRAAGEWEWARTTKIDTTTATATTATTKALTRRSPVNEQANNYSAAATPS